MKYSYIICALLVFCTPCLGSALFEDNAVLEVTLNGPVNRLIKHKADEKAFPFLLKADGSEMQIMASVRGNSRKKVCRFPPVKLDFDDSANHDGPFAGQTSLKLVTHCSESQKSQDNLLEEYAAYRIFLLFSDAAYRVRLLKINYEDTGDKFSTCLLYTSDAADEYNPV